MEKNSEAYKSILHSINEYAKSSKEEDADRIKKAIAASIKAYRAHTDFTQDQLARMLDVTRLQIVRWESSKHKPGKWAIKAMKELGIIEKDLC